MGLSEEQQRKSQELRIQLNGQVHTELNKEVTQKPQDETKHAVCRSQFEAKGCCQENGKSSCCRNSVIPDKLDNPVANDATLTLVPEKKSTKKTISHITGGKPTRKTCLTPTWLESWERDDTYAALAVICAAASVVFAYSCYKQL